MRDPLGSKKRYIKTPFQNEIVLERNKLSFGGRTNRYICSLFSYDGDEKNEADGFGRRAKSERVDFLFSFCGNM